MARAYYCEAACEVRIAENRAPATHQSRHPFPSRFVTVQSLSNFRRSLTFDANQFNMQLRNEQYVNALQCEHISRIVANKKVALSALGWKKRIIGIRSVVKSR
jgi:hypothetical protein